MDKILPTERVEENPATFKLILNSTSTKSSKEEKLKFPEAFPALVHDVKKQIEIQFSIPVCVQALSYQGTSLNNLDELNSSRIRCGDTLHVSYPLESDCKEVYQVITWMKQLVNALSMEAVSCDGEISAEVELLLLNGILDSTTRTLSLDLFYPWKEEKKYINKLHFVSVGGLDTLITLYSLLVNRDWKKMSYKMKFMECACVQSIANFTQTFLLRRLVVKQDGISLSLKSLLRHRLRKGLPVIDEEDPTGAHSEILQCVVEIALYAICNLSELPECQLLLAQRPEALNQAIGISLSPSYTCKSSIVAASLFLCLAQSSKAHPYLAQDDLVEGLLDACRMRESLIHENAELQGVKALESYTGVIFAQIILASPSVISKVYHAQIFALMGKVLQGVKAWEVRQYEEKEGLVWGAFMPYMKFLYLPIKPTAGNVAPELQLFCLNIILHALENALGRTIHIDILVKEGLLDYIICIPWHLPVMIRDSARAVIAELSKHLQIQPPKLSILAKAMLAKNFFGLGAVMSSSIAEIVALHA